MKNSKKHPARKVGEIKLNGLTPKLHEYASFVIDLRRLKVPQEKALPQLQKYFLLNKTVQTMLVITKQEKIIDFSK